MPDRLVSDLSSQLQFWYARLISDLATEGINARLIEGWRDPAYQDKLVAEHISTVCSSRDFHCATVGGKPASKAFDLGIFNFGGGYVSDGNDPRYVRAGALWEQYAKSAGAPPGMVWGGRFVHPKPDPDHFQIG